MKRLSNYHFLTSPLSPFLPWKHQEKAAFKAEFNFGSTHYPQRLEIYPLFYTRCFLNITNQYGGKSKIGWQRLDTAKRCP